MIRLYKSKNFLLLLKPRWQFYCAPSSSPSGIIEAGLRECNTGWSPVVPATPVVVGDEFSSTISVQCESVWPDHASNFTGCTGFVHQSEYRSSWQYSRFGVWRVSHQHIWLTVYSMSPIFQVDSVCVLRRQRILPYHRHVLNSRRPSVFCCGGKNLSQVTSSVTLSTFKDKLKTYLFHSHFPACNISPYWCTVTAMLLHLFT